MILNIIFIYDGMNSKWYGNNDEFNDNFVSPTDETATGGGLKVVSIGEGILAGKTL